MISLLDALELIGLPVLLACVVLVQGWWSGPRPWHAKPPAWSFPLALGLAALLAFVLFKSNLNPGKPVLKLPLTGVDWLAPSILAATVLGMTIRLFPMKKSIRFVPEFTLAFIAGFAMDFPGQDHIFDRLAIGIGVFLATAAGRTALLRRPAVQLPILGWMSLGTLALLMRPWAFGNVHLSLFIVAASMTCGALALVTIFRSPSSLGIGGHLVIGFLVASTAACAAAYVTPEHGVVVPWALPVLAFPAAALGRALAPTSQEWKSVLFGMASAALCCLAAIAWMWLQVPAPETAWP